MSTEHLKLDLEEYYDTLDSIFKIIKTRESGENKESLIPDNEICGETFNRLN